MDMPPQSNNSGVLFEDREVSVCAAEMEEKVILSTTITNIYFMPDSFK